MLSVDYSSGQLVCVCVSVCVCLSLTLSVPTLRLMKVQFYTKKQRNRIDFEYSLTVTMFCNI